MKHIIHLLESSLNVELSLIEDLLGESARRSAFLNIKRPTRNPFEIVIDLLEYEIVNECPEVVEYFGLPLKGI